MPPDSRELKAVAASAIDGMREELFALSRRIHEHPETAFHEVQAAE